MLATLAAPLTWAAGSVYARSASLPARPLVGSGMEMLVGGAVLVVAAVVTGEVRRVHPGAISAGSALAFAYLVVFGSLLAFSCYVWLLGVARTSLVSTYAYVNPLVAVLLGWGLRGERVTGQTLLAGALIVVAVAIVVRSSRARRGAQPRHAAESPASGSPGPSPA